MPKDDVIGLAMELDVSDIQTGIREVNRLVKEARDEFKSATAGMESWQKTSEGLNAKMKQLNTQLDLQKKAVDGYEAELKRLAKQEGDHSAEISAIEAKLKQAKTAYASTETQIRKYSGQLEKVVAAEKEQSTELYKLQQSIKDGTENVEKLRKEYQEAVLVYGKFSDEAKDAGKALDKTSKELKDAKKKMADLEAATAEYDDTLEDASKETKGFRLEVGDLGGALGELGINLDAKALTIGGLATGVIGLGKAFVQTADDTREYRTQMAQVASATEMANLSAQEGQAIYDELYSVIGESDRTAEAARTLMQIGVSTEEMTEAIETATGVYAVFGESIPIEGFTEAYNETVKVNQVTGALADAINWSMTAADARNKVFSSGIGFTDEQRKEIEEATTAEDVFNVAMAATVENGEGVKLLMDALYEKFGPLGDEYKKNNDEIVKHNDAMNGQEQAMARIGEAAEPLKTAMTELWTDALNAGADFLEWLDEGGVEKGLQKIKDVTQECMDNVTAILQGNSDAWKGNQMSIEDTQRATETWSSAVASTVESTFRPAAEEIAAHFNTFGVTATDAGNMIELAMAQGSDSLEQYGLSSDSIFYGASQDMGSYREAYLQALAAVIMKNVEGISSADAYALAVQADMETAKQAAAGMQTSVAANLDALVNKFKSTKLKVNIQAPNIKYQMETVKGDTFLFPKGNGVSEFALGGIVDKATFALIGEAGKEAVLPLENNTGWIDQLAADILKRMGDASNSGMLNGQWISQPQDMYTLRKWVNALNDYSAALMEISDSANTLNKTTVLLIASLEDAKVAVVGLDERTAVMAQSMLRQIGSLPPAAEQNLTLLKRTFDETELVLKEPKMEEPDVAGFLQRVQAMLDANPLTVRMGVDGSVSGEVDPADIKYINSAKSHAAEYTAMARGGIVNNPLLALIGEAGKEAVMPLENNTGWIDQLAGDILNRMNRGGDIYNSTNDARTYNFVQNNTSPRALSRLEIYRQTRRMLRAAKGVE